VLLVLVAPGGSAPQQAASDSAPTAYIRTVSWNRWSFGAGLAVF